MLLDSMSVMPHVNSLIGAEGVTYQKHYCTVAVSTLLSMIPPVILVTLVYNIHSSGAVHPESISSPAEQRITQMSLHLIRRMGAGRSSLRKA
jgi:hypothetical protein